MLRVTMMGNAEQAKNYFREALSQQDAAGRERYYSENQEVVGSWGGKGAARLQLSGEVGQAEFEALCDNRNPHTGQPVTPRTKENRRVGYDLNFHVPKSVSLYQALSGDERILLAFREAVSETMDELEPETLTRVRTGGQNVTRKTGELTWASFEHYTARPVNGVPDCHLHAHVVCFNHTWDAEEGRFKAMDVSAIKRDSTYYEAAFHNRMARKLKNLGFDVTRTAERWELGGIARQTIEKFAERTRLIDQVADELHLSAEAKDALGAMTRENKAKDFTRSELREIWLSRLTDDERAALEAVKRQKAGAERPEPSIERAFDYAKRHAFERHSVVSEKRFMAHMLRYGVGSFSVEEVNAEAARPRNGLITREMNGERLTTTPEVLAEEQKMLAWARSGRGACHAYAPGREVKSRLLSEEQAAAVRHVWQSSDRVMMIRGAAGVGKTTLMKEAVSGLETSGIRVSAFAPSADASRGTLRSEGFKADTLASLLVSKAVQESVKGSLIWVDEAGQIGTRDLAKLCQIADEQDCRLLLTGDIRQHGPVARGDAMRLLHEQSGVHAAEVLEIRRQGGQYKEAVKALSAGEIARGFAMLDGLGFIKEFGGREMEGSERHKELAADYVKAVGKLRGDKALNEAICIAPTHAEGARVTAEIRSGLKDAKRLKGEERSFLRLKKTAFTTAERGDFVNYEPGQLVQLSQNIRGFTRGERLTVAGRSDTGSVIVERENGELVPLPLGHADRFELFERRELAIAKGETVRITHNGFTAPNLFGKTHRLDNGSLYTVKGFTKGGDLKLTNGWVIPADFGHLEHGYVQTSYSSQSRSVNQVFIAQGAESLAASDMRQFYVSVSRGKKSARIYTDSKADLLAAVSDSETRLSAVELMEAKPAEAKKAKDWSRTQEAANIRTTQWAEAQARCQAAETDLNPPHRAPERQASSQEVSHER